MTRQKNYQAPEGHYAVNSLEEAFTICEEERQEKEVHIIGGGAVYRESLEKSLVDKMYITEVNAEIKGADTFFPNFNKNKWKETERIHHQWTKSTSMILIL